MTEKDELFFGYLYGVDGRHFGKIEIFGAENAVKFVQRHISSSQEIRVTDVLDFMVIHAKDGVLLYPNAEREKP